MLLKNICKRVVGSVLINTSLTKMFPTKFSHARLHLICQDAFAVNINGLPIHACCIQGRPGHWYIQTVNISKDVVGYSTR